MNKVIQKLTIRCYQCGHTWVAANMPMALVPLTTILQGSACQMCGGDNGNNRYWCDLTSIHEDEA